MLDEVASAGMADADAHPPEFVADMGRDRTQAIVARRPAAGFYPHLGRREVDLVVEDDDIRRFELVEVHGLGDGAARLVHVRFRLEQEDALAAHLALGD
jgi:hypothetical protein